MDFNSHMGNSAYLNRASDIRMLFFSENGFSMETFMQQKIGPVIMKDQLEYFKEIRLLEEFSVDLSLSGLSDDGSRFIIQNDFFRTNDLLVRVTSTGGWMDLAKRRLTRPPEALLDILRTLTKTDKFESLPSSIH